MKNFINEEKKIFCLLVISIIFIITYVFSDRSPEWFIFGSEIMELFYNMSLSIFAGVIFYIFQIYIPSLSIREIAHREFSIICNRVISKFTDMYMSASLIDDIKTKEFQRLSDFFTSETSLHISKNLNILGPANVLPEKSWACYLSEEAKNWISKCEMIASKYSHSISQKQLEALHEFVNDPMINLFLILNNSSFQRIINKYDQGRSIPYDICIDFFDMILKFEKTMCIKVNFSDKFLMNQKKLIGNSRL